MARAYMDHLMQSKYHVSVAQRLFDNFSNYHTKRFLSGTLTEMAHAASAFVNAYLVYLHETKHTRIPIDPKARLAIFQQHATTQLGKTPTHNVLRIFEIKRAQKASPIELLQKDKILLLDEGEYKTLTLARMHELLTSLHTVLQHLQRVDDAQN